MVCGAKLQDRGWLNMDILDHSEDEEERSHYGSGSRFGARWQKPRSKSHHQLLLMDSVGNGNGGVDGDGASEDQEIVPLPEYERLSQSARLPEDPDPKNPLLPEYRVASPPPPPPPPLPLPARQQKKPAAWRLIEYVRSRHRSGVPGGCGSSDGDSKSSDGERDADDEEGKKEEKNKKRSSWLPDRERRWPVQGFY